MLTLDDLRSLCWDYVPRVARHPNSFGIRSTRVWWFYAHEIGHLLTVPKRQLYLPLFGMDTDPVPWTDEFTVQAAYELAAMSVSRRLLTACGRPDLYELESEGSNYDVMHFGCWRRARTILRRTRTLRVPRTLRGLECRLKAVLR